MKDSLLPFLARSLGGLLALAIALVSQAQEPASEQKNKKAKSKPLPAGVEVVRDLIYSRPNDGGEALRLDLYRPIERDAGKSLPVVVWIHGGGWLKGSKDRCPAAWLAQNGFAVASVDYRLTDRAIFPAQIDDCRSAIAWLRNNAEAQGLDAGHIGAWGSSAGGRLVALMGTMPYAQGNEDRCRVQAVCDWFGPTELLTMPPNMVANGRTEEDVAKSNGAKLLGVTVKDAPDKARNASAIDHVSTDDVPFLIMHGSKDPGVPLEQSRKFHQRLGEVGVETQLHVVEGAGHGGKKFQTDAVRDSVLRFFEKHLK